MIIVLKKDADKGQVESLLGWLRARNIKPNVSTGDRETVIGCVGDVAKMDIGLVQALSVVESVQRIQEPYKAANRKFHPEDSAVDCSGVKVGGGGFSVIAGPCSVESDEHDRLKCRFRAFSRNGFPSGVFKRADGRMPCSSSASRSASPAQRQRLLSASMRNRAAAAILSFHPAAVSRSSARDTCSGSPSILIL